MILHGQSPDLLGGLVKMIINVESKDLLILAGEIQRCCDQLDNTDGAEEDGEISCLAGEIRQMAIDLEAVVQLCMKKTGAEGGGS